jgi:hypothetical protein
MTAIRVILLAMCATMSLQPTAGHSHEGHDDATPVASAMPGTNIPRIEAQSELFEIIGVVQNGLMTLFLDRYATNEPVADAFRNAALNQPGQIPVTFTITAGRDSDLLAGDLVVGDPDAAAGHTSSGPWWKRWSWAAGGLVLLVGIAIAWWSRRKRVTGNTQ